MMSSPIDFSLQLSEPVATSKSDAQLVYALVQIEGGRQEKGLPGNLGFLIDISDSMRIRLVTEGQFAELVKRGHAQEVITDGVPAYQISSIPPELVGQLPRRIDFVADALRIASDVLRDEDYFCLVAFAGQAQRLIEQTSGKQRARLNQAAAVLETLRLGDETRLDLGLALAYEETQRPPGKEFASRLILLTDGHTRNVRTCYEWARQARRDGIKFTTMGIGSEFNEELLIPLADLTGGNAYFIEAPQEIGKVFGQELGSALRVSGANVELKVRLANQAQLGQVYRVLPELGDFDKGPELNGSFSLFLGDYDAANPTALLLELLLPDTAQANRRVAQLLLSWEEVDGGGMRQNVRKDVILERLDPANREAESHLADMIARVQAYELGAQALSAASVPDLGADPARKNAATIRLRQAATSLLDMGETALADAMLEQADQLEQKGVVDAGRTKKLRYETRRISQHS